VCLSLKGFSGVGFKMTGFSLLTVISPRLSQCWKQPDTSEDLHKKEHVPKGLACHEPREGR